MAMSIRARFAVVLLGSLLSAAPLLAQQTAPSRVSLDVVVTARSGPPVGDLQQADFRILDNKVSRPIVSFQAVSGSQEPIHVFLVLDAVNSPFSRIAYAREQIEKFLHANGGRLAQPVSLAFFTDKGTEVGQDFTTDGNELSAVLDHYESSLRTIHRSSQWEANDRLNLSINALGGLVTQAAKLPGRKLIFWVSPGWPLLSGPNVHLDGKQTNQIFASIVGISTELRQAGVILYAVDPLGATEGVGRQFYYQDFLKGVSKPGQVSLGDLSLQVLAEQSGGLALHADNDIAALLEKCMVDAAPYYRLSFDAPPADHRDEYHSLEVQVSKPGLVARTRQGYYAQP
jgi:VWFA-related protein